MRSRGAPFCRRPPTPLAITTAKLLNDHHFRLFTSGNAANYCTGSRSYRHDDNAHAKQEERDLRQATARLRPFR
jgi:hypothetical protein